MEDEILIPNFFKVGCNGDKTIRKSDLGWTEDMKRDARSDYPETIFRYFVEIEGLNILFYYMEDRQFYSIETEKDPIEVRRLFPNPNWDGKCELSKAGENGEPHTNSRGEIIATFDKPTDIWSGLIIGGKHIDEVIANSFIVEIGFCRLPKQELD